MKSFNQWGPGYFCTNRSFKYGSTLKCCNALFFDSTSLSRLHFFVANDMYILEHWDLRSSWKNSHRFLSGNKLKITVLEKWGAEEHVMGGRSPPPLEEVKTMITGGDFARSGAWAPHPLQNPCWWQIFIKKYNTWIDVDLQMWKYLSTAIAMIIKEDMYTKMQGKDFTKLKRSLLVNMRSRWKIKIKF